MQTMLLSDRTTCAKALDIYQQHLQGRLGRIERTIKLKQANMQQAGQSTYLKQCEQTRTEILQQIEEVKETRANLKRVVVQL